MRTREILSICFLLLCLTLTACSAKKESSKERSDRYHFPGSYTRQTASIEIDLPVIAGSENKNCLYKCTAEKKHFAPREIASLIWGTELSKLVSETDENSFVHKNKNSLYVDCDYIAFNSNSEKQKSIMKKFSLFPETYTADQFPAFEDTDEGFTDFKEKGKLEELFYSMGITNLFLYKAYLPEEEIRYWIGTETCQGLPVFCSSFYNGFNDTWSPVQALYTPSGIEKIQVLYYFNFSLTEEKISLKPFDEIADALEKEYSMLITDYKHAAIKAELSFWVNVNQTNNTWEMLPVWIITIREFPPDTPDHFTEYEKIINAETAEVLEAGE